MRMKVIDGQQFVAPFQRIIPADSQGEAITILMNVFSLTQLASEGWELNSEGVAQELSKEFFDVMYPYTRLKEDIEKEFALRKFSVVK